MPPFLSKIINSPAVRKAAIGLVITILAALGYNLTGCSSFGQLNPKAQRAVDTFECYVATLSPYVGEVCDTADLVRDVVQGKADLARTLILLGATQAEVSDVTEKLAECRPQAQIPLDLEAN